MKNIHICFPEGKHKVLTFSYDDGRGADRRLIEIFNKNGLKATFHLNSGFVNPKSSTKRHHDDYIQAYDIRSLYKGHEVACHTVTHPTIARSPIDHVATQVIEDRRFLEQVTGMPVQGFSYPNGSYSDEIKSLLPQLGIKYARVVGSSGHFSLPNNYFHWQATCHHNHKLIELGESFKELHKSQYLYMMSVWGHSFEFDRDDNWDLIARFAEMMSNQEDIWYATNIEIVRYMEAAKQLVVGIDTSFAYNPSALPVWININGEIKVIQPGETLSLENTKRIALIGDSTVQSFSEHSDPKAGWGQYINNYFTTKIQFENYAIGGRSTKSFIKEGRLEQMDQVIKDSDYVFVQMGHNDASKDKPERYTDPHGDYKTYLKQYIDYIRERGSRPILITPVPTLAKEGDQYKSVFADYCQAMKEVAAEEEVQLIDLMAEVIEVYQQLDDKEVEQFYQISLGYDDYTHFTKRGAKLIASILATNLKKLNKLFSEEALI